jgi:hypothetical protein
VVVRSRIKELAHIAHLVVAAAATVLDPPVRRVSSKDDVNLFLYLSKNCQVSIEHHIKLPTKMGVVVYLFK